MVECIGINQEIHAQILVKYVKYIQIGVIKIYRIDR